MTSSYYILIQCKGAWRCQCRGLSPDALDLSVRLVMAITDQLQEKAAGKLEIFMATSETRQRRSWRGL